MSKKLDVLNRGKFISKLILLVEGIVEKKQGCCFGIDGAWGSGKTFVLEKFEEQLKDIQCEETADNRYYVFHYDCWKYDYYDEPIIAIISAMLDTIENEPKLFSKEIQQVGKLAGKTVKDVLKAIVGELTKNKIGINLVEVANGILEEYDEEKEQNKQFDSLYGFRKALEATRAFLNPYSESNCLFCSFSSSYSSKIPFATSTKFMPILFFVNSPTIAFKTSFTVFPANFPTCCISLENNLGSFSIVSNIADIIAMMGSS